MDFLEQLDEIIVSDIKSCLKEIKLLTDKKYVAIYANRIERIIDKLNDRKENNGK